MQFDLANSPAPLSFGAFDRNGNDFPKAAQTYVAALKNGGPFFDIQDSREDRGSVAQVFVEPESKILLFESIDELVWIIRNSRRIFLLPKQRRKKSRCHTWTERKKSLTEQMNSLLLNQPKISM